MAVDIDRVVATYVKMRDARAALKRDYEARDQEIKAKMEKLDGFLLGHLIQTSSESVRTEHGTFYRQKDLMVSASDWAALYAWIKENDAFDALERRVTKTFVAKHMEENDGEVPPGISTFSRYVVRVRKN